MEASQLAQRILFGDTLEDKLFDGGRIMDRKPGVAQSTPDRPGRPAELHLDGWHERQRVQFGEVNKFNSDKERGLVLHFFANHELLALELIALALLKFPDAPPKFRRGLIAILKDEQRHLSLYVTRMSEIGVAFGEIPVSDFFWRSISGMETPMDFVTRLSLTLEQANLDYAPHYRDIYKALGDDETSALMGLVYRDEIRHVRYGLNWFEAWRNPQRSQWEAYCDSLGTPLTPNRAKGIGFNKEGRRRAGLSDEFVGELELYSRSRGRCPSVYWFNPTCDQEAGRGESQHGSQYTPTKMVSDLASDLASLPMFMAAGDDVVLVPERPAVNFLRTIHDAGFAIPEFVSYGNSLDVLKTAIADRKVQSLRPWGWSPTARRVLGPLVANLPQRQLIAATADLKSAEPTVEAQAMRVLYSKSWSVELLHTLLQSFDDGENWLCDSSVVGEVCLSREQVGDCVARLRAAGHSQVVIKGPFGAAGQDQMRLNTTDLGSSDSFAASVGEAKITWLQRLLRDFGEVVVEPWLAGRIDLSAQFMTAANQPIRLLGITRFVTDARGQYVGSFVHQRMAGLDERYRRFLYDGAGGKRLQSLFEHLGAIIQQQTDEVGYSGPLGVDALVYDDEASGQLRLKPVIEVNPRYTMGHLALKLAPRVNASRTALWTILRRQDVIAAGFAGTAAFADHLRRVCPCQLTDGGLISGGILLTSDPAQARSFTSLLVVGRSLADCAGYFEGFSGPLGRWARRWG